jgi:hypothetical protein
MMAPLDPSRDWMLIPTWPSVKDLARRYPERTYVRTIPHRDLFEEECEITRALTLGGHRKADRLETYQMAVDVIVDDLHDIAFEHGIDGYRVHATINAEADLEVTMVFRRIVDMVHFKLALP